MLEDKIAETERQIKIKPFEIVNIRFFV